MSGSIYSHELSQDVNATSEMKVGGFVGKEPGYDFRAGKSCETVCSFS